MNKIGLFGNYGANNLGDDLIMQQIILNHPNHKFTIFSAQPKISKPLTKNKHTHIYLFPTGIRSLLKLTIFKSIKELYQCKVVIMGGGTLFQDNQFKAIIIWSWQFFWIWILRKPLFIYATGIGPLKYKFSKYATKKVYKYATQITVRDYNSKKLLLKLGINPKRIIKTNDPVFAFIPKKLEKKITKQFITISLRNSKIPQEKLINTFTIWIRNYLKNNKQNQIALISMQDNLDTKIFIKIKKNLSKNQKKRVLIIIPKDKQELIHILSQTQIAIGMRLHFNILCALTKTPFLPIYYSDKVKSLCTELKISDLGLELNQLHEQKIQTAIIKIQKNQHRHSFNLKKLALEATKNKIIFNKWFKKYNSFKKNIKF